MRVGQEIQRLGQTRPGETTDLVDRAEQMVFELAQERVSGDFAHINDLLKESFARIMHLYEAGVDVTIPGTPVHRGRLHLLTQIRREIEDIFIGNGVSELITMVLQAFVDDGSGKGKRDATDSALADASTNNDVQQPTAPQRLIKKLRGRFGSILIPATDFKTHYLKYNKEPHILISGFDQSPGTGDKAYWMQFFNNPTGFVKGGEKGARINKAAVVFLHFYPKRRGYYKLDTHFVTADARSLEDGALTLQYARYIETCVRRQPANYLWSHRRWKLPWKPEYKELWIDESALPDERGK